MWLLTIGFSILNDIIYCENCVKSVNSPTNITESTYLIKTVRLTPKGRTALSRAFRVSKPAWQWTEWQIVRFARGEANSFRIAIPLQVTCKTYYWASNSDAQRKGEFILNRYGNSRHMLCEQIAISEHRMIALLSTELTCSVSNNRK